MTPHALEAPLEGLLKKALLITGTDERWSAQTDEMWCRVGSRLGARREQGWKLHVSATVASAPEVLTRALDVLLRADSAFKFARSLDQVSALNTRGTPRGSSGKFLTVYPRSDSEATRLAQELHRATEGLTGPRILSDQFYAPHSLVHYRYGSFVGRRRLSEDGLLVWFIEDPDGNPVEDKRTGQYLAPTWAVCPFPSPAPSRAPAEPRPATSAPPAGPVLLGGRFEVREAIRQTNKGGVYRGTDVRTGGRVVIKEARPHVEADVEGRDVRDWLRAEAEALEGLRGLELAPAPVAVFEHGEHLFLAQEEVPGVSLSTWVAEHFREAGADQYGADALQVVTRLVELVSQAHARGYVLRDLTPGNVMVRPDGGLRLIDLELAVLGTASCPPTRVGTPGYSAPERLSDAPVSQTADYYSLGATACLVLAGKIPTLLADEPATRTTEERLATWLTTCAGRLRLSDEIVAMLLGLMRDEPAERWNVSRAREALRTTTATAAKPGGGDGVVRPGVNDSPRGPVAGSADDPVAGITDHLISSMTPTDDQRLWPVSTKTGETDPCTVQQGAAGVLAVLTRYFTLTGDPRLPEVISTAGHWIADRSDAASARPGLHFGSRGIAWALHDAGRAVDDRGLTDHAVTLALAPLRPTPSHDITHGTAGSGTAALHMWHHTGDRRFAELAGAAADRLVAAADRGPDGVSWAAPAEAEIASAGKRYLGFAHGSAGIGSFLLAAAAVSGRRAHRELAVRVGEGLLAHAVLTGETAHWPAQATDAPTAPYWCHGAAGIGTYLVQLWQTTGDDRFGDLARRGAHAVAEQASRATLAQCHGLAGNGDFLLDMAAATGDPVYRAMAEELADLILTERVHRQGHTVFPTEYGDVSTSWSDGSAGILAFLLRLRHPSLRHWMVQPPV
ncbi:class IV lanthionine synthetase LanL [Streptomyces tsukubensis]|uniref:Protein kinase domain-containing protein n=1 Tax=Streptomyces tsukubensis TaxID=83656 RepID=A0A1V4A671_9ACTN|nr:class IV lanthionine synthetase LanL [Streptomyces tsukubensis]OON76205.1 hypothetical protein B1H18_21525 [Streptomyces tsukubensis]QFR93728.1 hypothetical protein GBW32_12340 [Streptomyces tsukubensis]